MDCKGGLGVCYAKGIEDSKKAFSYQLSAFSD